MRAATAILFYAVSAIAAIAAVAPSIANAEGAVAVTIHDDGQAPTWGYTPATTTIEVGQTVTWTNAGQYPHDAAATDGSWKTPIMLNGGTATATFSTPGTYSYICSPHPWMQGTIVVTAAAAPTAAPSAAPTAAPASSGDTGVSPTPGAGAAPDGTTAAPPSDTMSPEPTDPDSGD